eukprot:scaffold19411_cov36-Phaeocystis_antarctica.AAC.1
MKAGHDLLSKRLLSRLTSVPYPESIRANGSRTNTKLFVTLRGNPGGRSSVAEAPSLKRAFIVVEPKAKPTPHESDGMPQTTEGPLDDHLQERAPIAAAALAWLLLCPGRAQTPVGCWYLLEAQSAQAICSAVVAEALAAMIPLGTRSRDGTLPSACARTSVAHQPARRPSKRSSGPPTLSTTLGPSATGPCRIPCPEACRRRTCRRPCQ